MTFFTKSLCGGETCKSVNVKGGMALRNGIWNGMRNGMRNDCGMARRIKFRNFRFDTFLNFINFTTVYNQPRSQGLRGETVTKTLVKFVLSFQNFGKKIACAMRHNRIAITIDIGDIDC